MSKAMLKKIYHLQVTGSQKKNLGFEGILQI